MTEFCEIGDMPKAWCAHCKELPTGRRTVADLSDFRMKPNLSAARGLGRCSTLAMFDSQCPECFDEILQGEEIIASTSGDFIHLFCAAV